MSLKKDFKGENYAKIYGKTDSANPFGSPLKTVFRYNIDLLKHLCVVAKIEKTGIMRILSFLHPSAKN